MPILAFLVAVLFFLIINLFLALFLSSIVLFMLKLKKIQIENAEMSFLIFICCSCIWIGIRVIMLNFYSFENFTNVFLWPMNTLMPKDIITFLSSTTVI